MSYRIAFDGSETTVLSTILEAVERDLNVHSIRGQTSTASISAMNRTAGELQTCPKGYLCIETKTPHGPFFIVVGLLVAGAIFAAGYAAGKASASAAA